MKDENKRKKYLLVVGVLLFVFILIGASFAYYSATVNKTNETNTKIETNTLGLIYTGEKEINYQSMIPGDSFEKTFTVENTSNTAVTYNIYMQSITNQYNEDLVYTLYETDSNGANPVAVVTETSLPETNNDKWYLKTNININAAPTKKYYKLVIEYKYLANAPQNDYQGKVFEATLGIDTVQNASNPLPIICKRANPSTLHTEICEQQYSTVSHCRLDYELGDAITYGNATTTSGTLTTGDAFDCDVNGDGNYNPQNERFYYVTNMDANTAFLMYYNDYVSESVDWVSVDDYYSSGLIYTGPITAIKNLPTTNDWPNVSLTNSVRNIKNDIGEVIVSGFDYGNRAARLITYQEIESACYDGETEIISMRGLSSKCQFLMENTNYSREANLPTGTWLENAQDNVVAWRVFDAESDVSEDNLNDEYTPESTESARPGIEVPLSQIDY